MVIFEEVSFWRLGTEIWNGSEGTVNRIEAESGVKNVAEALMRTRLRSEDMRNAFKVTNRENGGKGVLFPGFGKSGSCGTGNC